MLPSQVVGLTLIGVGYAAQSSLNALLGSWCRTRRSNVRVVQWYPRRTEIVKVTGSNLTGAPQQ